LLTVGLALDEQRLLGDSIRCVGLLGISVPEILLAKRHRSEFRIGTNRPEDHGLFHAVATRGFDELDAHDGVVVEEAAGVGPIGADATYDRGQVNHNLRPMFREETLDGVAAREIVIGVGGNEDVTAARLLKPPDQVTPEESRAARDYNSFACQTNHECLPSAVTAS
jgi:hypothetical protein